MSKGRVAQPTIGFVGRYCEQYRSLFKDVRSFEYFSMLHVGLISAPPRKSLPAIARALGLSDGQELHHLLAEGDWSVEALREKR